MTVIPSKLIVIKNKFYKWRVFVYKHNLPLFFNFLNHYFPDALVTFKKYLKLVCSLRRKELDIYFLASCVAENIIPSFIFKRKLHECLQKEDIRKIHRKILRRMLETEKKRRIEIMKRLTIVRSALYNVSSDLCFHWCNIVSNYHANKISLNKIETQNKKLKTLRKLFGVFEFNVKDTVLNLSNVELSDEEINLLKFGPKH